MTQSNPTIGDGISADGVYVMPCCNYKWNKDDDGFRGTAGPIFWNPFNQVVQCHHCGASFTHRPQSSDAVAVEKLLSLLQRHHTTQRDKYYDMSQLALDTEQALTQQSPSDASGWRDLIKACDQFRDTVLHTSDLLDGENLSSEQVNAILGQFDDTIGQFLPTKKAGD